jgi:RES domain-containing protein
LPIVAAYRLSKSRYAATAFTGEGARLYGGRWSPTGVPVVYLSESLPLAALEVLVHLERPPLLETFVYFRLTFDSSLVLTVAPEDLPEAWNSNPEPLANAAIGEAWFREQASAILHVPSAVVPGSYNFLLNPVHPDFELVEIDGPRPFAFDSRLSGR